MVIIMPRSNPWSSLIEGIELFTTDYMTERLQPDQKKREPLE